jgi:spermidine synthase
MNLMNHFRSFSIWASWLLGLAALLWCESGRAQSDRVIVAEPPSKYHQIQVYDEGGIRTLSFNGSWETKMSLRDPLTGHFEYTEYFQMPFIWNPQIKHVLMAGLGGGSTQRAYQHYFTNVMVDTVELDPVVVEVAKKYFNLVESPILHIHTNDARQFLRLSTNTYDLILMDAYYTSRYGSAIPQELTTREFFTIAHARLGANGVLGYNIIGQITGYRQNLVGAMYRTMKEVFPQVYMFPANESQNIVFIATKSREFFTWDKVQLAGNALVSSGVAKLRTFSARTANFMNTPPPNATNSTVLTDDFSPIESLMRR